MMKLLMELYQAIVILDLFRINGVITGMWLNIKIIDPFRRDRPVFATEEVSGHLSWGGG